VHSINNQCYRVNVRELRKILLTGLLTLVATHFSHNGHTAAQESDDELVGWEADAALVERLSAGQKGEFNYRESSVPNYSLPNPLRGIPTPATPTVLTELRQQTRQLFRDHVYGNRPTIDASITFVDGETVDSRFAENATSRKVECVLSKNGKEFRIPFVIHFPQQAASQNVPLVVFINNRAAADFQEAEKLLEFWAADLILARGFATAMIYTADIDPDRGDGYQEGVRGFLAEGKPRASDAWGSLSAWGWGASQVVDYALQKGGIDPQRIAVVGHSRGGKTALWAAAEDERFTIAYSNQSGCGGAALSRRRYGETIDRITRVFPHWFCEKLNDYRGREDQLPVDQHQLIGLIAPRSVYVTSAAEDLWADPRGEYLSVAASAPVYQLYGQSSISTSTLPPLNMPRIIGPTGYHIRDGAHDLTRRDWEWFLKFAELRFLDIAPR
jgi:pimeloyl-ACP methyl ester carboxylesterase